MDKNHFPKQLKKKIVVEFAVDRLGFALVGHAHKWTAKEKGAYNYLVRLERANRERRLREDE